MFSSIFFIFYLFQALNFSLLYVTKKKKIFFLKWSILVLAKAFENTICKVIQMILSDAEIS